MVMVRAIRNGDSSRPATQGPTLVPLLSLTSVLLRQPRQSDASSPSLQKVFDV